MTFEDKFADANVTFENKYGYSICTLEPQDMLPIVICNKSFDPEVVFGFHAAITQQITEEEQALLDNFTGQQFAWMYKQYLRKRNQKTVKNTPNPNPKMLKEMKRRWEDRSLERFGFKRLKR